jgi:hypothetical protein
LKEEMRERRIEEERGRKRKKPCTNEFSLINLISSA